MRIRSPIFLMPLLGIFLQGCYIVQGPHNSQENNENIPTRLDFADPLLNHRQVFIFGSIDQAKAERAIKELLFLEAKSHEPIDLYLHTPGGELKHFMAIEQVMVRLQSPVNTIALAECNSGGAMLLAAGSGTRKVHRGAVVILHGLKITGRPPPELQEQAQEAYNRFWRKRTKLPASWLPLPPNVLHVLSAEQALEYGVVDQIIEN